ncbi:6,7-dimethyl-8-ribityllumazine synthase [Bordetella avium]|nr:6,7-dimethyl-8-ribityllumazine synthase [Bordetella avium]RIQ13781.1 6,7-dimethyl-8-ribityllumazine synthase [Bordetella avium]RIQ39477.1 6,7-dimethyl-8-ribityllumazine synthase [Bordetella avium]RIQ44276.1 6,7-dimethyl-8-ribityllumazine synthase [Bordetella avium]RIQ45506.1 6,7-dimethyl-8-ribityllumazine synthase [Bordetella avium]RIQ51315.1 6,7-dimethyl-8-ribityllumazine synthase [Bordetella avium]
MRNKTPTRRIAYIQSSWHADLLAHARLAFYDRMAHYGCASDGIVTYDVPGAFEIPLLAQRAARSGQYEAIVGAALVVDGGIYRHEFVAQAVIDGLMRVQLETNVPVFSMSLTPHHFHSHSDHQKFFSAHLKHKGKEVADACDGMLNALNRFERSPQTLDQAGPP